MAGFTNDLVWGPGSLPSLATFEPSSPSCSGQPHTRCLTTGAGRRRRRIHRLPERIWPPRRKD